MAAKSPTASHHGKQNERQSYMLFNFRFNLDSSHIYIYIYIYTMPHRHNEIVAKLRCSFTQFLSRETGFFLFRLNAFGRATFILKFK